MTKIGYFSILVFKSFNPDHWNIKNKVKLHYVSGNGRKKYSGQLELSALQNNYLESRRDLGQQLIWI